MDTSSQDRSGIENADTSGILKRLETYGALVSECNRYALLGRNAERNRHTVRPHIYAKVRNEYAEKMAILDQEQEEQKTSLQSELETVLRNRRALNERCRQESDRLEELDFRVRVGEFPEEEAQDARKELKDALLEITMALADTQEVVSKFEQVGLLARATAPRAETDEGKSEGPSPEEDDFLVLEGDPPASEGDVPVVNCPAGLCGASPEAEAGSTQGTPDPEAPGSRKDNVFGYLVALDGSRQGERFPLINAEMTLGSSPDIDIRLADSGIARYHARIVYRNGRHYLETMKRAGVCLVNGVRKSKVALKDGDVLSLGKVKMQVEYAREANA